MGGRGGGEGVRTRGSGAVGVQRSATADFAQSVAETEELRKGTGAETGTTIDV